MIGVCWMIDAPFDGRCGASNDPALLIRALPNAHIAAVLERADRAGSASLRSILSGECELSCQVVELTSRQRRQRQGRKPKPMQRALRLQLYIAQGRSCAVSRAP